ncbi:phosphate/phosphite/phosphonate ABC transporter substrate-binding protein [Sulfuricurvum sp.]|uniref:phosphate/phosphite/phosphonate ABC transporter substrate-binding protein n=1 Tax=Sulfuricurvum sp. TaxID=2025608 RepID=UPI0026017483|nr:phosphate/phosphite/phosphonate ABC transporter substrate-binding protein [Sulfuricurvum sp.]MDD4950440.1 phosphate/phosphite/phosphonate ABC transporter substrate-binding protein [Sulfuricurvum sp.]
MKVVLSLIALVFLTVIVSAKPLIFGVVPQQSPMELAQTWKPIISYLENATGEKINLKIERSIPDFEHALYNGQYDIAYMNPYHYVVAHKRKGYMALIRDQKNIVGIIVVRKDSALNDIKMLKGKRILFPAPDSFAATLLPKYELYKKYGIDIEKEKNFLYVNSHDSVYKGVSRGIGDAGGGIERTYNSMDDAETKTALTILYKTDAYPSHPIALLPSVSSKVSEKMQSALLHLPEGLIEPLKIKKLIPTEDSEYNSVRGIAEALPSMEDY